MIRTYKIQSALFNPSTVTLYPDKVVPGIITLGGDPAGRRGRSFSSSVARLYVAPDPPEFSHSESMPLNDPSSSSGLLAGGDPFGGPRYPLNNGRPTASSSDGSDSEGQGTGHHHQAFTAAGTPKTHNLCTWRKSIVTLPDGQRVILHSLATGRSLWETDLLHAVTRLAPPVGRFGITEGHQRGGCDKLELRPPRGSRYPPVTLRLRVEFCLASASFHWQGRKLRWTLLSNALGIGDGAFVCMDTGARQPVARYERSVLKFVRGSGRFSVQDELSPESDTLIVFSLFVALEYCRLRGVSL
ncbi:hypothetical protein IWQ60_006172 [Tieghemiomyces parasiticus]|uniref:Uncharacterized protein n=1 Tax=Tieghemiomyces parasiticus TaxID=78921 RepID=A0A9W8A7S7_9FUNG|nr:hypothetical protein IWQ60_006172 [Tieghemiomyces parasiticus]